MTQLKVYITVAATVALLGFSGARLPSVIEVALLAGAVLLLGVPHGAMDVLHARYAHGLDRPARWFAFLALYALVALAVVAAWFYAPTFSLIALLVISAGHFSGDLGPGSPLALRCVHGAAPVCLPALLHREELGVLFSALAPASAAATLAAGLAAFAGPLLIASVGCVLACARRHRVAALEVAATAAISSAAPPLTGFVVYFCLMHSWRHVDRTRRLYSTTARTMLWAAGLPTLATAAAGAAAWFLIDPASVESGLLQVVFVGLAALTVPHMILIERVRWAGWSGPGEPPDVR